MKQQNNYVWILEKTDDKPGLQLNVELKLNNQEDKGNVRKSYITTNESGTGKREL